MIIFYLILIEHVSGGSPLTGPNVVRQCAGKNIQIVCRYHNFYRNYVKYWCRGYHFNYCSILIRTDQPQKTSGSLEITDDKTAGLFTVYMKNIKAENSGWYWCAIERVSRHVSFAVELIISKEGADHCSVPTPHLTVRETTALGVTTRTLRTSKSTETTSTSQTTSRSTVVTEVAPEVTTEVIHFTPIHKLWGIVRWFAFLGLNLFLFCFTMYTELWGGR